MKRDMDLCRTILLELEENEEEPLGWVELTIEGYKPEQVSYHVKLLYEAGLIEAKDTSSMNHFEWYPTSLTWSGHEFLDAARDQTIWKKVKSKVLENASGVPFEVLKELLIQTVKSTVLGQ